MRAKLSYNMSMLIAHHENTHRPSLSSPRFLHYFQCANKFEGLFVAGMAPNDPEPLQDTDAFKGSAESSDSAHQALLLNRLKRVEKWVNGIPDGSESSRSAPQKSYSRMWLDAEISRNDLDTKSIPTYLVAWDKCRADATVGLSRRSFKLRRTMSHSPYL